MIRFMLTAGCVALFIWFGSSVNLGHRTLFGHIGNIWSSEEAQEMREDVGEKTKPLLDKAKQGARRGIEAIAEEADAGIPALDAAP